MKKLSMKVMVATSIFVSAMAISPVKAEVLKDSVRDERGGFVITKTGDCVRTKWDAPNDVCGGSPRAYKLEARAYMVFFDFDKSNLTDDAKGILKDLARATDGTASKFEAIGHADRSGSDQYNMALSERRAESVKGELVRLGIKASDISLSWKGEREPLVQTQDGIKEPQNRRVEIKVKAQR